MWVWVRSLSGMLRDRLHGPRQLPSLDQRTSHVYSPTLARFGCSRLRIHSASPPLLPRKSRLSSRFHGIPVSIATDWKCRSCRAPWQRSAQWTGTVRGRFLSSLGDLSLNPINAAFVQNGKAVDTQLPSAPPPTTTIIFRRDFVRLRNS